VVGEGFVRRGRLNERLNAGERGMLTVVSAPAGYGKSTQVSDWAGSLDGPCAWVSVDEQDSAPVQFLAYVVAAVQAALPGTCEDTATLLQGDLPAIPVVARILANELDAIDAPWVLILDDYHRIERSSEVHGLVGLLLEHPPRHLRLVVVTRRDPPLPLHALRAAGRLTEVRVRDLLFTRSETGALLDKVGVTLSGDAHAHLEGQVEGWPVGLRLLMLALRDTADPEAFVMGLHGGHQHFLQSIAQHQRMRQVVNIL
jgi:LuxR family maltose regulon positive regulatory protein